MGNQTLVRLGRNGIAALVEYLEANETWTTLEHLLFQHGLDGRFSGAPKLAALGRVFYPLVGDDADDAEVRIAREVLEEIAQRLYQTIKDHEEDEVYVSDSQFERASERYQRFQQALRADGFDLVEGRLSPFLSSSVEPAKEQGVVELRLRNLGFSTALLHHEQAVDNAARGNWEAANGQVRSFMESVCEAIAAQVYQGTETPPTRGNARKYLADNGFLTPDESALLQAFFQVLHGAGGHSGTSDEDDCHRRRLMAIALANYYLDRLENWGG